MLELVLAVHSYHVIAYPEKRLSAYKDILLLFITNLKNKRSYYSKVPYVSYCQSYLFLCRRILLQNVYIFAKLMQINGKYDHFKSLPAMPNQTIKLKYQ